MPRTRPAPRPSVERKIYFYRAQVGNDDAGRPLPFDPRAALRHINSLSWALDGRYWQSSDGQITCCWVDRAAAPQRVRLGNVRRSGLPLVEQAGQLSALQIPATAGLAEQVHMVFFRDNIVGAEFNFYGPRLSRLERYLTERAGGRCPEVSFEPLLRQDIAAQLDRLRDIRLFQLKIRASYIATVATADQDLGSAFRAAAAAGNAQEVEITLSPRKYSRGHLSEALFATARRLLGRPDLREEASRFSVRGLHRDTERVELIDLLSDYLIAKKQVVRESARNRAVDSDSAYAAIEQAYSELRDDLRAAAAVRP